ncbi:hypothetical protein N008_11540 [Hymenobacter sp. APR13]|nr:hypothetical protein N008_11540 [Hymenobacter sp. APR13]
MMDKGVGKGKDEETQHTSGNKPMVAKSKAKRAVCGAGYRARTGRPEAGGTVVILPGRIRSDSIDF